ncbi:MAG: hypothetical protein KBD56_02140 [Candidatus Eisenbacteria bacterium]|nr:hypothetical protein [Candidatus Eisenbacteria bacterium]
MTRSESTLLLRCRQCGWTAALDPEALPVHGARPRCGGCESLLPLVTRLPAAASRELDTENAAEGPAAGTTPAPSAAPGAASTPDLPPGPMEAAKLAACTPQPATPDDSSLNAGKLIAAWLQALDEREGGPVSEAIVWAEHGMELARMYEKWRRSGGGETDGPRIFREAFFLAMRARR